MKASINLEIKPADKFTEKIIRDFFGNYDIIFNGLHEINQFLEKCNLMTQRKTRKSEYP